MKRWVWIALGLLVLIGAGLYYLINMDRPSDTAKSNKGVRSVKDPSLPTCSPAQIADLAKRNAAGTLRYPYPCSTVGVSLAPGDPLSPEMRFAAQIGGVQPYINRSSCYAYGRASLKSEWSMAEKRDKFENEVCGWRRGRPGCPYADRFRDYNS